FMAPEQVEGRKDIDHRADLYALGVMLFRMLTGQYPFDGETFPMLILKICTESPPPIRTVRPDLPVGLDQVLLKAIGKNRDDRYATCADFKAALQPFRAITTAPVVAPATPASAVSAPTPILGRFGAAGAPTPVDHGVELPVPRPIASGPARSAAA